MALLAMPSTITENGMNQGALVTLLRNIVTKVNELENDRAAMDLLDTEAKTFINAFRAAAIDDIAMTSAALGIGSNADDVASGAFYYLINGSLYLKAAVTTGTGPGNDVIPTGLYGAVAFEVGTDGTIDAIEAPDNATGYASAALAAAALPAASANHARMGYVTASKSDGEFTFGTTNLNASNTTVAYTNATPLFAGLSAAITATPASVAETDDLTLVQS